MKTSLTMLTDLAKPFVDKLASRAQRLEEAFYPDAVLLRGFPRLLQLDRYSCAVQSACMILRYFRKGMPIRRIESELGTTAEDGTSRTQLTRLLVRRNLKVETVNRCTHQKLRDAIDSKAPVLVFVDQDHCAVLYGYFRGTFFVADPALNRAALVAHSTAQFRARWDRVAIIVRRRPAKRRKTGSNRIKTVKRRQGK